MDQLWDAGLQPERTALAWQRTCLACAAGSLAVLRLAVTAGSALAALLGAVALLMTVATAGWLRLRYRRMTRRLNRGSPIATLGPALPTALAIALLGLSVLPLLTAEH